MKWILVVWFLETAAGDGVARALAAIDVEFDTEVACEAAGENIKAEAERGKRHSITEVRYVCVEKGTGRTKAEIEKEAQRRINEL